MDRAITIEWKKRAVKQLLKIPALESALIYEKVSELRNFPCCSNVKKLMNHTYGYRLRVRKFRVLFNFFDQIQIVSIEEVKRRDDNTY